LRFQESGDSAKEKLLQRGATDPKMNEMNLTATESISAKLEKIHFRRRYKIEVAFTAESAPSNQAL
jgi:hypothetical protein